MQQSSECNESRWQRRQAWRIATALVMALVVTACTSDPTTSEDSDAAEATTPTPDGTVAASPDPTADDQPAASEDEADGDVLTLEFAAVPEGTWRVEALGTPFDIDIEGEWWVQPNGPGWVVFTAPDSRGPGDDDVVFIRPTTLVDPIDPGGPGEGWPLDDIPGWLDAVDGLMTTQPIDTEVGGHEGLVFEVEVTGSKPVEFVENAAVSGKTFDPPNRYIVYWLDQGEHEPIAIVVGANDIEGWRPTAESLLETVAFGESAAHPSG